MFNRILKIDLPKKQSAFLWGARKTGKSTYLKAHFQNHPYYDLLKTEVYQAFLTTPHQFREEVLSLDDKVPDLVIVDEVQKLPALLDEIHWLIENSRFSFLLCGSSARKLIRSQANLLGGRAWRFYFFPLTYPEIPEINLLKILNQGLIPSHYLSSQPNRILAAYVQDYLQFEIQQEGLVRNLPAFARFLEAIPFGFGELVNFTNISRDCGVDAKTVKEYYQILVDTLLGYFIYPLRKKNKRDMISATPKFYFFDVGVANFLSKQTVSSLQGAHAGALFEQYIFMEIKAYISYQEKRTEIAFWRTKTGHEVDFILNDGDIAIECKISSKIDLVDLKGLQFFIEEHQPSQAIVVCLVARARKITLENDRTISILPWQEFLERLWQGKIIQ